LSAVVRHWSRNALIAAGVLLIVPAAAIFALRWFAPPISAYMLWTRWSQSASPAEAAGVYYHWVAIEDMSACMPLAVVAAEDQTFPYHRGFAWAALRGAMSSNLVGGGGGIRGASTISQQTAKNLFLWPARSYVRKMVEGYLTLWLELLWPKRRILEMYLNIAQFGPRVFGVAAAAKHLFGTTAGHLNANQCAALAAVLPSPTHFNAAAPSAYIKRRIRWIRQQMRQLGSGYLAPVLASQ